MVFPETKLIINEAVEKYEAFANFYIYLEKRVDALIKRKIANFGETTEGIRKANLEIKKIEDQTRRRQLNLLQLKAKMFEEPMFSSIWETHMKELDEVKEYLKPFEESIAKLETKIEEFKQIPEKKRLLNDIDKAQSMYESVVWLLMKGSLYESAHSAQEQLKQQRLAEMKAKSTANCEVLPQYEGYWKPEEKDLWKKLAEAEYEKRRKKYFENLEKIQKRKEDQKK